MFNEMYYPTLSGDHLVWRDVYLELVQASGCGEAVVFSPSAQLRSYIRDVAIY